jgi:YD repeat-containing protein
MTHLDYKTKSHRVETFSYNSYGDIQEKIDDGEKLTYIYEYF